MIASLSRTTSPVVFGKSQLLGSIRVDDVTGDRTRLRIAMMIAAENYARISCGHYEVAQVYEQICRDVYHDSGRSRTLLATGLNPRTGKLEALGTCRCVLGTRKRDPRCASPLELMTLVEPEEGWRNYTFGGFDAGNAAELGRFAIPMSCREGLVKEMNFPIYITRRLIETGMTCAHLHGKDQVWGIMPDYMVRRLRSAGFLLTPAPRIHLRYEENREMFQKFAGYWIERNPRLYRIRALPIPESEGTGF